MGAFAYKLEQEDGTPADPPILRTAVSVWARGDTIPLGGRTLRVVETRPGSEPDGEPVLIVETRCERSLPVGVSRGQLGGAAIAGVSSGDGR